MSVLSQNIPKAPSHNPGDLIPHQSTPPYPTPPLHPLSQPRSTFPRHLEDALLPKSPTVPSYLPPMTPSGSEPRYQMPNEGARDGSPQRAKLCASQDDGIIWMSS
ncbi:hypothetical protein AX15_003726 [Amanita polypyramis BW_CC]|nr:hypothetical protein AX15_003726 [Amanita polypyramis BW_CC]